MLNLRRWRWLQVRDRPVGRPAPPLGRCAAVERLEPRYVLDAGPAALPDFELTDVNSASDRFQQSVSPRDYLEQVSAWYFGHAT